MLATAQVFAANALTGRAPIGFYAAQNIYKRYPWPFRFFESKILANANFAFPLSGEAADILTRKGLRGFSLPLPLYVDTEYFYPHPDGEALRTRLVGDPNELLLGYVGRFVEEKGLLTLLQALSRLTSERWRLVLLGGGRLEATLRERAKELGIGDRLVVLPAVDLTELAPYMTAFDALVLPSETRPNWKEQFGRVLVEALACGTPLIGSSSGSIPEIVRHTEGGLVFEEGDAADLAEQISMLSNDRERLHSLARQGRLRALESYALDAVATRMRRYFEWILATHDGRDAAGSPP